MYKVIAAPAPAKNCSIASASILNPPCFFTFNDILKNEYDSKSTQKSEYVIFHVIYPFQFP